jgi:integrase
MGKLTDKIVRELSAPAVGNTISWDSEVKGFGVRITARGARGFVLDYRAGGRQRRYTIGSFPDWPAIAARNEAARLKQEIDRGRDPMVERRHERQAPTMAALCDRYLAEHADIHNKPRTRAENRRIVERIIKPKIGRLKVEAVDHEDVARMHRELKPTPRQANHVVAVLSKMFHLAERWKLRPLSSNPCRHVRRYPERQRDRYPLPEELERVGAALRAMEAAGELRTSDAACIRFLALVGCRLSEAVELNLESVNFRTGIWTLPDAKAGARPVMLGAPALVLLAGLGRATGRAFVRQSGAPVTVNMIEHAWSAVRDRADARDLRLHDLRHGVGTYAGAAGLNAFLVRDLLGHKTMSMTGRYVSKHADPLRAAADAVSGQIAAALEGPPADLVPIRGRG